MYEILVKEKLTPVTWHFVVQAPAVARKAQAGQFVIVRNHERGERIPLTVADYDRARGTLSLVVQEVGKTTMQMGAMVPGDCLASLTGPLGEPTEIDLYGTVLCIGGGFAIAPIYPIARALKQAGNTVLTILCRGIPFVTASVRGELNRRNVPIHVLASSNLLARRDANGKLQDVQAHSEGGEEDCAQERTIVGRCGSTGIHRDRN